MFTQSISIYCNNTSLKNFKQVHIMNFGVFSGMCPKPKVYAYVKKQHWIHAPSGTRRTKSATSA